jgi:hypothetical protein
MRTPPHFGNFLRFRATVKSTVAEESQNVTREGISTGRKFGVQQLRALQRIKEREVN